MLAKSIPTSIDRNVIDISGKHLYGFKFTDLPNPPAPLPGAGKWGFKASLLAALVVWREVFFLTGDV